jgi:hypothetical protein
MLTEHQSSKRHCATSSRFSCSQECKFLVLVTQSQQIKRHPCTERCTQSDLWFLSFTKSQTVSIISQYKELYYLKITWIQTITVKNSPRTCLCYTSHLVYPVYSSIRLRSFPIRISPSSLTIVHILYLLNGRN